MKTLAPFAILCLCLLGLAAWYVKSVGTTAGPREPSPSAVVATEEREPSPAPRVDRVAPLGGSPEGGDAAPAASAASAPSIADDESRAAPPMRSTVRWAGENEQQRAKQRFIELRAMLADDPRNEAALEAALELARGLEWHNEACDLLSRLVRLRGDDADLRFEFAVQLMRLERWLEAIPQLRAVLEHQPDNARAWYNLAVAHQALGHLRDGRAAWSRVLELMPQNPDAYAHRGEILLDLRAWEEAAADFATSLHLDPGSLDATLNLSLALTKLGRSDEAHTRLLPLLERHPVHISLLNRLAEVTWTLYQADPTANQARAVETLEYCTRSLALNDNQPEIKALRAQAAEAAD